MTTELCKRRMVIMKRIKLRFARGVDIEFVDRDQALKRIEYWAEHGTSVVQVVYGPEGCGKTAWLKQSVELLRGLDFDVIYVNPIEKEFMVEVGVEDVKRRLLEILREASNEPWVKLTWVLIDLSRELIRAGRRKIAVLADDIFQAIGPDKDPDLWVDKPPEKDVELGVGNHAAWQSPLHKEAVKRALIGD